MPSQFHCQTIETCEGTACAKCKVHILHCTCAHNMNERFQHQGMNESISAQGWVPQTEAAE